ncbi:MAG TPA: KTSC domain-containing protein [Terriglobales bacterium]|nr:KTSC domain-containing protein [Terriglobales bacterium]
MERVKIVSSNISEAGFDPASRTLELMFVNGRVYQYFDVPQHVFDGLCNAPSAGQYFNQEIRGIYRFARA